MIVSNAQEHWTLLLCTEPKALPFKRKGLGLVHRSTGPVEILKRPVLLCTGPKPLPFKGKGLGPVYRSTVPVEILTRVQFCQVFVHVSKSQRVQCSYTLDPSRSPSKGKDWVQCTRSTGPVEILTRVQFCQVFVHVSKSQRVQCKISQRVQCSCALDLSRSLSKGALDPLRS
uniref:Uncharacterized protein n=1 Tax=Fagus sylvatica TaxID=28930 RepID=A0A2N9HPX4_FAGSY